MSYFKFGHVIDLVSSIINSNSTTVLSYNSYPYQNFTGSQNQTIRLPNATTTVNGQSFTIVNSSSGMLTVEDANSVLLTLIPQGSFHRFTLVNNSSSGGVWGKSLDLSNYYGKSSAIASFNNMGPSANAGYIQIGYSGNLNSTLLGYDLASYRLRFGGNTMLASDGINFSVGNANASGTLSFLAGGSSCGSVSTSFVWTLGSASTNSPHKLQTGSNTVAQFNNVNAAASQGFIQIGYTGNLNSTQLGYDTGSYRLRFAGNTLISSNGNNLDLGNLNAVGQLSFYAGTIQSGSISTDQTWTIGNLVNSLTHTIQSFSSTPLVLNTVNGASNCGMSFKINSASKATIQAMPTGGLSFYGASTIDEKSIMDDLGTWYMGGDDLGNVTSSLTHRIQSTSTNILDLINGSANGNILMRARYNNGTGGTISDLGRLSFVKGTSDATRFVDLRLSDTATSSLKQVFVQYADGHGYLAGWDGLATTTQASWSKEGNWTFGGSSSSYHLFKTSGADHTYLILDKVDGVQNTKEIGIGVQNTGGVGLGGAYIALRRFDSLGTTGTTIGNLALTDKNNVYGYLWVDCSGTYPKLYATKNGTGLGNPAVSQVVGEQVSSDERVKENIKKNKRGIHSIMQMETFDFEFKNDSTKEVHTGFIAQQLQPILPHLVKVAPELTMGEEVLKDVMSVNYMEIIPICVKAIQDLKDEIDILKRIILDQVMANSPMV